LASAFYRGFIGVDLPVNCICPKVSSSNAENDQSVNFPHCRTLNFKLATLFPKIFMLFPPLFGLWFSALSRVS